MGQYFPGILGIRSSNGVLWVFELRSHDQRRLDRQNRRSFAPNFNRFHAHQVLLRHMAVPGGLCSAYRLFVSHLIENVRSLIYEISASLCHLRPFPLCILLHLKSNSHITFIKLTVALQSEEEHQVDAPHLTA